MTDFKKLITRFRQFGGMRLVIAYAKLGALWTSVKAGVRCLVKGQSFKGIYPEVLKRVEPFLVKRYAPLVSGFKFQVKGRTLIARMTRMRFRITCGMRNQGPFGGVGYKALKLRLLSCRLAIIRLNSLRVTA